MADLRMATRLLALALLPARIWSGSAGSGDILERFIAPVTRSEFMAETFERRWAYYPHNDSVVAITLDHVSEWLATDKKAAKAVELLQHPVTGKTFRPDKGKGKRSTLQNIQDAFLHGHSMVINSLHQWSEPGSRLARELYQSLELPVDVYMYLTPPHSKSYDLHQDVMDAWMLQLAGAKTWKVCDERNFAMATVGEEDVRGRCQELTMRGGDVMYLPFLTLHKATTHDELSAHLTVNIERQYFVWSTLLLAALHKTLQSSLVVEEFAGSGSFQMEGESATELFFANLMQRVPRLVQVPLSQPEPLLAARWLTRPLSGNDLPEGYATRVAEELRSVSAEAAQAVFASKKLQGTRVELGGQQLRGSDVAALLKDLEVEKVVPWILELARFHCLQHFSRDNPQKLLPTPDLFSSFAAARSDEKAAQRLNEGQRRGQDLPLVGSGSWLVRRPSLRAVLLHAESATPTLLLDSKRIQIARSELGAVEFALGLFGPSSAQGRPFPTSSLPGGFSAEAAASLERLVAAGALRLLPGRPEEMGEEVDAV